MIKTIGHLKEILIDMYIEDKKNYNEKKKVLLELLNERFTVYSISKRTGQSY